MPFALTRNVCVFFCGFAFFRELLSDWGFEALFAGQINETAAAANENSCVTDDIKVKDVEERKKGIIA